MLLLWTIFLCRLYDGREWKEVNVSMKLKKTNITILIICSLFATSCGKELNTGKNAVQSSVMKEVTAARDAQEIDRSYAGIIPFCKEGEGWGAVSTDSEEIVPFRYSGLGGISYDGLMIFYDGERHFIYDSSGELRYEGDDDVSVSGDRYGVLELQDDGSRILKHYTSEGEPVDEDTVISAEDWSSTPSDRSGIRRYTLNDDARLEELPEDEEDYTAYSQVFYGDGAYESSLDGVEVWHYMNGTAMVKTADGEEPRVLGVYDAVIMTSFRYWPVQQGETWGYVDHMTGKVPDKAAGFEAAATFSDGYAIVIKGGNACVINEDFDILEDLGAATGIRGYGRVWQVGTEDGSRVYTLK